MKYHIKMPPIPYGLGDAICFVSACREFARKTGNTVFITDLPDVIEAYKDPDRLRYGEEGALLEISCLHERCRSSQPKEYGNYYGTYLAAMGIHTGDLPQLDLPIFPKGNSYPVIQPFSNFAANPPIEYVQKIVDIFKEITGRELFVIGNSDTPRVLTNVRYDLLGNSVPNLMNIIQDANFIITGRSVSAHLAAGYGRPSFVWVPDDGENWHLNYPGWLNKTVKFSQGMELSAHQLKEILCHIHSNRCLYRS